MVQRSEAPSPRTWLRSAPARTMPPPIGHNGRHCHEALVEGEGHWTSGYPTRPERAEQASFAWAAQADRIPRPFLVRRDRDAHVLALADWELIPCRHILLESFVLLRHTCCRGAPKSNGQECPWLTLVNRRRRARNDTQMARPVRPTAAPAWRRHPEPGRRARPAQGDTASSASRQRRRGRYAQMSPLQRSGCGGLSAAEPDSSPARPGPPAMGVAIV